MTPNRYLHWFTCLAAVFLLSGCGDGPDDAANPASTDTSSPEKKVKIAYITNGVDPFWNIAENGALKAAREFNVECDVYMPPNASIQEQKQYMETKLITGVDGIALSPIKPEAQNTFLNDIAKKTMLSTHDSDAPDSGRMFFVGMDNYKAGRAAGKLVKEAIPEGGKIMIFVGRMDQLNARQRRQGVIDEVLGLPMQDGLNLTVSPVDEPLSNDKFIFLDTRTDNFNMDRAKANAEDAINAFPDLKCMVGLFAYNIPNCLQAVRQAGMTGKIALVSFDENNMTLEGIKNGEVHGTISQQPFEYGYHSIRILAALKRGDQSAMPENNYLEVPILEIRKDNVVAFAEKVAELSKPVSR